MFILKNEILGYIGTYTTGDSKGIYNFILNLETGELKNVALAVEIGNPTYLTLSKNNKYLYSVAKVHDKGGTAAFSIKEDGSLQLLNYEVEEGNPPCYVSLDYENKYLLSANYHKGEVLAYPLSSNGNMNPPSSRVKHEGSSAHKTRQDKPHAHYINLTPDGKYVCAIDLGMDELLVYSLQHGKLNKIDELCYKAKPGSGVRHLVFHPNGKYAYIFTELTSEIISLEYNSEKGFKELQYISSLPEDFIGESAGSAIRITQDGKFLYASNRGHDSIAVFKINSTSGDLQLIEHVYTNIKEPRDFNIDPTGSFLIAANQNNNTLVSFSINKDTGKLTYTGSTIKVSSPVCVVFKN